MVNGERARRYAPRGVAIPIAVVDLVALSVPEYRGDLQLSVVNEAPVEDYWRRSRCFV